MKSHSLPLLVANWKANLPPGEEVLLAGAIARDAERRRATPGSLMIAPSALGLVPVASLLRREHPTLEIEVAAQDVSDTGPGAHTGETPATHLSGIACAAIVGHSERRMRGETSAIVGRKVAQVVAAGLSPIICIGDTSREASTEERFAEVRGQWEAVLESADRSGCGLRALLDVGTFVAYEPVWAIGSGAPADAELAGQMAAEIRTWSSDQMKVLYGGSVHAGNAATLFAAAGPNRLEGLLVGGASLSSERLLDIAAALGTAT